MPNQSLPDLTERTATADSDLIHVNSGGSDYKQTKANFLKGDFQHIFNNTSALTAQVDALPVGTFFGSISAYGSQTATGLPINANCYVKATKMSATTASIEIWSSADVEGQHYITTKTSNTWGSWVHVPNRSEITSLNNSLTNRLIDISSYFSVGTGISVTQSGVQAFYDPYNHSVRVSLFVTASATFNTSTDIFTITNSAYRPTVNTNLIGMVTAGGIVYPFRGTVYTNGSIRQLASGICTSAYFVGEYKVA